MKIRTLVAAACLVGLVGGCSSDPKPAPLPPVPSASPAPSPLPLPSEAAAATPQGAAAFTSFFFETVNAAYAARDPELVRSLATPACGSCDAVAKDIERLSAEGHVVGGRRYVLTFSEAAPAEAPDRIVVDFGFTADPYVERDASGAVVKDFPAQTAKDGQTLLVRRNGAWLVEAIRVID